MMSPEQVKQMLKELGLPTDLEPELKPIPPCANEEEREKLREELSKLHYEGNLTDGFALVGCQHQWLFRAEDCICAKCGLVRK